MGRINRRKFFVQGAAAALTAAELAALNLPAARAADRQLGTCGPPPRKNPQRQTLFASAKNEDAADEPSDRLGSPLQTDDASAGKTAEQTKSTVAQSKPTAGVEVGQAREQPDHVGASAAASATDVASGTQPSQPPTAAEQAATKGTVVVDVDGGVTVPSFLGKPLRSAVESAQQSGFEINVVGSGVAREQWPPPGSRLPAGQHITVRFGH